MFHLDWIDGKPLLCGPCDTCKIFLSGVGCKVWKTKKVEYVVQEMGNENVQRLQRPL